MKIIVDAFGGDNAPVEILKGCELALQDYNDLEITLTGPKEKIIAAAKENSINIDRFEIADCSEILTMDDHAGDVLKKKKDSSMAVGLQMLADGKAQAFLSAGNSGALITGATLIVKRIKGIKRPAFSPVMPDKSGVFMLIDGGANTECKPEMLQQFAIMGSVYMNKVMKVDNPRVGLANVGTEDHKGDPLRLETFELLKNTPVNFIGNIEGRDIPYHRADVVVADGFTGNLILKTYEGLAAALMDMIKGIFTKSLKNKLAAAMILGDMKELKTRVDYSEYGGAPILGAAKPVFKIHGDAKAKTVRNAIKLTTEFVGNDIISEIAQTVANLS
ncbi:MAG: phosphate acyltransferase PlsX [Lachnospiraceae bacterium]|nr:phosphate acyltransferase PlsX [Lachnospiraceae bacterium]